MVCHQKGDWLEKEVESAEAAFNTLLCHIFSYNYCENVAGCFCNLDFPRAS